MGKSFLRSLNTGMTRLARFLVGIAFTVLIISVTIQVLGRSGFFDSPVWTEELTRFALLYLTAFGVGVSLLTGDLVNVDIVVDALPRRIQWVLQLVCAIIIVILCFSLLEPAWRFTEIGAFQTSPALGWQMTFVHASMLCLLGSLGIFALLRIASLFLELSPDIEKQQETNE